MDPLTLVLAKSYVNQRGVSVTEFGARGDGVSDDYDAIMRAINGADVIYFPRGVYGISRTIVLNGVSNKTFVFQPGAVLYRLPDTRTNDSQRAVLYLTNCSNFTFHDLTLDSGLDGAANLLYAAGCTDFSFFGVTTVRYSSSWTFVIRTHCSKWFIETIVVEQPPDKPTTRDGVDIVSANNIVIGTVIGRGDNGDDLVVVKSFGPPAYNISIGSIVAYGSHGAFAIGSELIGDVYNISVGQVIAYNTVRGLYFKKWDRSSEFPDVPLSQYGKAYNITVGSLTSYCYEPGRGRAQLHFDIDDIPEFVDNYEDVHIGSVLIEGAAFMDLAVISRVKNLQIDNFTTRVRISEEDTRETLNRYGLYITHGAQGVVVNGGRIQAVSFPLRLAGGTEDFPIRDVIIRNVTLERVTREGQPVNDQPLVSIATTALNGLLVDGCKMLSSDPVAWPAGLPTAVKRTLRFTNNFGRDIRDTSPSQPPSSGQWLVGEIVYNRNTVNPYGWICVQEGDFNDPSQPDPVFEPLYPLTTLPQPPQGPEGENV